MNLFCERLTFVKIYIPLFILSISLSFAQAPDTLWTKVYGGVNGDVGFAVQQTADGGYRIAGTTESFSAGSSDGWLLKIDPNGDMLWNRTYGGTDPERGYSVKQTQDGGYIIVGTTNSFGNGSQVYLIKTDKYGDSGIEDAGHSRHLPYSGQPLVCPNPFVSFAAVRGYEKERFILYDISGRRVGCYFGDRIGFGLPTGVYFVIPIDQNIKPIRVVKIK